MKCETSVALNQHLGELDEFVSLLASEGVKSYLEIGSKFGCSLWRVAKALPPGSKLVSVDLPSGDTRPHLEECLAALTKLGYETHLIIGDSTNSATIKAASDRGPYDVVFIDANHTTPYVTKDWQSYGSMGKIIAFHDINGNPNPPNGRIPIQVKAFWDGLKGSYRHREIIKCKRDNGIGVLWK
jgi:predicted O-methyltransferase YrrM